MRKSKFFMIGCGLLIAVSGAFATKAVNKLVPTTVWYTNSQGACVSAQNFETEPCDVVGQNDCVTFVGGANRTIYQTTSPLGQCIDPYKTSL